MNPSPDSAAAQGWHDSCVLRASVLAGSPLPTFSAGNVRLNAYEVVHGDTQLMHETWCGMDVTYEQNRMVFGHPAVMAAGFAANLVGNSIRRARAERQAREQWRPLGWAQTLVTNQRVLAFMGNQWRGWPLDWVMELWPAPSGYAFTVLLQGEDPLRLSGPWAPWHCVVLAYLLYGPDYLAGHPEFQAMGRPQSRQPPTDRAPGT
ncbi:MULTISPECIES: hypothetical protein [unclassified Nonomuraea]|uniref:hypothetical protein n=1 Tax=unclassified Nonomuraea TaxID=2593643 RepID=UPI0033E7720A